MDKPIHTGTRALDVLFPYEQTPYSMHTLTCSRRCKFGGTAVYPGAFGGGTGMLIPSNILKDNKILIIYAILCRSLKLATSLPR